MSNKINWLFETDKYHKEVAQLAEEVRRQGHTLVEAAEVPYREGETYLNLFPPHACVVFYGTLGFSKQIQRETLWVPGTFHSVRNFLCSTYYPHLLLFLLASSGEFAFTTFGKLTSQKELIFKEFGIENTIFVRPDSGEKPFTGQLIEYEKAEDTLSKLGYEVIPEDMKVIVSEPRNIDVEWRFVIADSKVIAGSRYLPMRLRLGSYPEDKEATLFANKVACEANWQPDRVWCMDVCRTQAGNYYVLEINSFSCSGLYACDPKPIVEHVSRIALDEWEMEHGV